VVSLLDDPLPSIRATSLRLLTHLLGLIRVFPPSDAKLFPQYIFKHVSKLADDEDLLVRIAFAEAIVGLAETAKRFLDVSQAMTMYKIISADAAAEEGEGVPSSNPLNTAVENTYDAELQVLHSTVKKWFSEIIMSQDVRSAIVRSRECFSVANSFAGALPVPEAGAAARPVATLRLLRARPRGGGGHARAHHLPRGPELGPSRRVLRAHAGCVRVRWARGHRAG
jgi:hypothetical protein